MPEERGLEVLGRTCLPGLHGVRRSCRRGTAACKHRVAPDGGNLFLTLRPAVSGRDFNPTSWPQRADNQAGGSRAPRPVRPSRSRLVYCKENLIVMSVRLSSNKSGLFSLAAAATFGSGLFCAEAAHAGRPAPPPPIQTLGRQLFEDTSLSISGTQSCATCHVAEQAFTGNNHPDQVGS